MTGQVEFGLYYATLFTQLPVQTNVYTFLHEQHPHLLHSHDSRTKLARPDFSISSSTAWNPVHLNLRLLANTIVLKAENFNLSWLLISNYFTDSCNTLQCRIFTEIECLYWFSVC